MSVTETNFFRDNFYITQVDSITDLYSFIKRNKCDYVLVLVYATWCGHCRWFKDSYKSFAEKIVNSFNNSEKKIHVLAINIDIAKKDMTEMEIQERAQPSSLNIRGYTGPTRSLFEFVNRINVKYFPTMKLVDPRFIQKQTEIPGIRNLFHGIDSKSPDENGEIIIGTNGVVFQAACTSGKNRHNSMQLYSTDNSNKDYSLIGQTDQKYKFHIDQIKASISDVAMGHPKDVHARLSKVCYVEFCRKLDMYESMNNNE